MYFNIKKPKGCIWLQIDKDTYKGINLEKLPELFNAGYILLTEYTTFKKVKELVDLGDLYHLKEEPTAQRAQDKVYECEALHRDFDEPFHQYLTNSESSTKRSNYNYLFKVSSNNLTMQWYFNLCENYQILNHDSIEDEIDNPTIFKYY